MIAIVLEITLNVVTELVHVKLDLNMMDPLQWTLDLHDCKHLLC